MCEVNFTCDSVNKDFIKSIEVKANKIKDAILGNNKFQFRTHLKSLKLSSPGEFDDKHWKKFHLSKLTSEYKELLALGRKIPEKYSQEELLEFTIGELIDLVAQKDLQLEAIMVKNQDKIENGNKLIILRFITEID